MDFILVPDSLSARHIRQTISKLANSSTLKSVQNIKVGTFNSLLSTLKEFWLLPDEADNWKEELQSSALKLTDVFWLNSIKVDELTVLEQLDASLIHILKALPLNEELEFIENASTSTEQKYNDLVSLHREMNCLFPLEIAIARQWYGVARSDSLEHLNLFCLKDEFTFDYWQVLVIEALNDIGMKRTANTDLILSVLERYNLQEGQQNCTFSSITQNLFISSSESLQPVEKPDNFIGLKCRDAIVETEIVTAMIQASVYDADNFENIVVMYPKHSDYPQWLAQAFEANHVPFSNIVAQQNIYDWQTAFLRDAITIKAEHTPPMALMSLLLNPLMPWNNNMAHYYARKVKEGRLDDILDKKSDNPPNITELLTLLLATEQSSNLDNEEKATDELLNWLEASSKLLTVKEEQGLTAQRMKLKLEQIKSWFLLYSSEDYPAQCTKVLNQLQPNKLKNHSQKMDWLNSVTLISEDEVYLKPIKHLYIVGFSHPNYGFSNHSLIQNTIFNKHHWLDLKLATGMDLTFFENWIINHKINFRNQMSKPSQGITITYAEQDFVGDANVLSETALDLALCFNAPDKVDLNGLFTDVFESDATARITKEIYPKAIPAIVTDDLNFNDNLLSVKKTKEGAQRPESPSSLETMMISPLAWLLESLSLTDQSWEIESLDIQLQGTIAHRVFELYQKYQGVSDSLSVFPQLYKQAVLDEASFLLEPKWRLEFKQLEQQIQVALTQFVKWQKITNWKIISVEQRIMGELWNHPMKGFIDSVLNKESGDDNSVLILDYKKSKSDGRLERLNSGFDIQNYVYRALYEQNFDTQNIYTGYYNLNDQTMVLDQSPTNSTTQSDTSINEVYPNKTITDQSVQAKGALSKRFEQLRSGYIELNSQGEVKGWKDFGITPYALQNNPIINRFFKSEEA